MEKENNPIYERNTLEFVTVALEFCTFVENAGNTGLFDFLDKAVKILPLLYLKATLLPEAEEDEDAEPELTVTEDMYESRNVPSGYAIQRHADRRLYLGESGRCLPRYG